MHPLTNVPTRIWLTSRERAALSLNSRRMEISFKVSSCALSECRIYHSKTISQTSSSKMTPMYCTMYSCTVVYEDYKKIAIYMYTVSMFVVHLKSKFQTAMHLCILDVTVLQNNEWIHKKKLNIEFIFTPFKHLYAHHLLPLLCHITYMYYKNP